LWISAGAGEGEIVERLSREFRAAAVQEQSQDQNAHDETREGEHVKHDADRVGCLGR
jgi:hypothetical protein